MNLEETQLEEFAMIFAPDDTGDGDGAIDPPPEEEKGEEGEGGGKN